MEPATGVAGQVWPLGPRTAGHKDEASGPPQGHKRQTALNKDRAIEDVRRLRSRFQRAPHVYPDAAWQHLPPCN